MWRAYGGFSWAFKDYFNQKVIMPSFDTDVWKVADNLIDPLQYSERME